MDAKLLLTGALFALAGGLSTLPAQMDLTPRAGVFVGEGTPFPCIRFADGMKVVRFMPPTGWRFTAEDARCAFHPPGVTQASGSFVAKPRVKDATRSTVERLEDLLISRMPADGERVEFTFTGLPAIKVHQWEAIHGQASYEHFGQKFRVALLIVPMEKEDLHIRFGARAADFERTFIPLLESLGTFVWDPTDEDPPERNAQASQQK